MQLKVNYQEDVRVFWVNRKEDTYQSFFDAVLKEYAIEERGKKKENFRLRSYNIAHKIMTDTYTGGEQETLEALKIYPMRTYALEEKGDEEMFEEYDPSMMEIKVNIWRPHLTDILEETLLPSRMKVKKDMLMSDFIQKISDE